MVLNKIDQDLKNYYNEKLSRLENNAQKVGWKNREAQWIRFEQLLKIISKSADFSLNDLGCGIGDLLEYMQNLDFKNFSYRGYDVMPEMIAEAEKIYQAQQQILFKTIPEAGEMEAADYVVASGIFNIRYSLSDEEWKNYILTTLRTMNEKSHKGFAFNALTKYSDKEFMKGELYYSDPLFLFDFCKINFSKNVALLHDYNQYDFTILVRKEV